VLTAGVVGDDDAESFAPAVEALGVAIGIGAGDRSERYRWDIRNRKP
jgi:hypothetical protein